MTTLPPFVVTALLTLLLVGISNAFGPDTTHKARFSTALGPFRHYLNSLSVNTLGEPKIGGGHIVDEQARLAKSTFPIPPDELIDSAKNVLRVNCGVDDPSVLSDEFFQYCSPFVGPISKKEFLATLSRSNRGVQQGFPDLDHQYYNFHVDPWDHNRVWYHVRPVATHTGAFQGKAATSKRLELPPQAESMTFDKTGKVLQITNGYVMDNKMGNTGGIGGVMGLSLGIQGF